MNIMTLCLEAGVLSKLTETQPMEPSLLPDLGLISGLIGLGFAILFALMMFWVKRRKTNMSLTWMFVIVWVFGFVVYDVGMYTGNKMSLIGNAPMAMLEAFGMFLINSDVSAIHDPQHKSWVYMCCFSLAHFMAAFISMMFVIKHFGFNILAGIRMFVESVFRRKRDNTYLFWGMNSQSYCLAKDIENIAPKGDYRIIVVRASNDSETTSERNGMDRLLNFLSLRNKDLDRLIELDCLTTNSFSDLSQISVEENIDTYPDILKNNLRLRALKRIIKRKTAKQLHVFLITENYQYNIQATTNLKADRTINEFVQNKGGKVTFYCHARYNSVHRVIEDEHISENIEVRVIDSAHIAVESLKREVEFQPVSFVDINSDATVSTPFKSLVVGFGEVGFDSVRFLYEFGAFVKGGSTNENVERSPFECHVVDVNMADQAGLFVANSPSIEPSIPFMENHEGKSLITLHNTDCRSVSFYENLEKWLKDGLNYVVMCTGDDELNISLAVRIFRLAMSYRPNMEHFVILVHIANDSDGHIAGIANHYNRLWAAERVTTKKNSNHQKIVRTDELPESPIIRLFGLTQSTYTYKNIIDEDIVAQAKDFKAQYDESIKALERRWGVKGGEVQTWDEEFADLMQLTDEYRGYSPTYSALMRLRRVQQQNIANCLHKKTKEHLAEVALGEKYKVFREHQLFRRINHINYEWKENVEPKSGVTRVLDVLAQTEHLRWNASHEILRYREIADENDKDEVRMLHGCLKKWQDLSTEKQSYDYNVVDVTLGIVEG